MADVLILIPARMAATRLPGKPLADIAGVPMIVHVLRRAEAAAVGPVVVATDSPQIAAAVEKAGGRAVMTRADHASGSDRIFEALGKVDPGRRAAIVVNVQGDLPTLEPADIAAAVALLAGSRPSTSPRWRREITRAEERDDPSVVKVVGTPVGAGAAARALFHPRHRALRRRAALSSYRALRLPPRRARALRRRCRRRRWSSAKSSSSCARSRPACASMSRSSMQPPLGVDTPEDLERARAMLSVVMKQRKKIAFQGEPGANSHIACAEAYPGYEPLPCPTFEDAFAAVRTGRAELGMIPIDNSVAGRVADIHHLMPRSGLHIVGEWFLPVQHQLMAPKGATLHTIKTVESHVHALGQCRNIIRKLRIKAVVAADTAGAAREVAEAGDISRAALATKLAAKIYGCKS